MKGKRIKGLSFLTVFLVAVLAMCFMPITARADNLTITDNGDGTYSFTMPAGDVTVTADVTKNCTVSFEAGEGGTGTMPSVDKAKSSEYTLPACTFTAPEGKVFKKWSVKIGDAQAVAKNPGDTITVTADTTLTAVWASTYTLSAATRLDNDPASVGNVTISQTAPFKDGDEITLTAPDKDGYHFLGWYPADATEFTDNKRLTEKLKYVFTINADTNVVAVYQPRANVTVTIGCINEAQYTVNDDPTVQHGNSVDVRLGAKLTLHAVEEDKVLQWQNASGKVLGTSANLEITVTGNMSVTLVYKTVSESQSYLQYVADYGQVLQFGQISSASTITAPTIPFKYGYIFDKWIIDGSGLEATEANVKDIIGKVEIITVRPTYTKDETKYGVTVNYRDADGTPIGENTKVYENILVGTNYTVTAPAIDGYKFKCWMDGATVLGYATSYPVKVTGNVTLTASYVTDETVVTAVPVITLCKPFATENGDVHKITCIATRDVPAGYTLVEQGMLWSRGASALTETDMVIDSANANVNRYQASDKALKGTLTANIKTEGEGDAWKAIVVTFRGYMILKDQETGHETVYYTTVESASHNTLNP